MISKSNTTTQVWGFFSFKLNESNMDKPLFESGGNKKKSTQQTHPPDQFTTSPKKHLTDS